MSSHVDKIAVVVEDFEPPLSVQSFELDLAVNTIPIVQLNVLPIERVEPGNGHYTTASAPKIQDITKLYSRLLEMATRQDATATIKISVDTFGEDTDELSQTVTLEKWLLTDVGLSTVTPTSAPVLTVVFSHPAVKLDKTGFVYESISNPMNLSRVYLETGGTDIISYMDDLYEKFANGSDVEYFEIATRSEGGPDEAFKQKVLEFRSQLTEFKPGKYIECNTGDKLFLEYVLFSIQRNIKEALGPVAAPFGFTGSTWKRLVSRVCPVTMSTVVPTYDREKLLLEPFSPWQACSYNINTPIACGIDVVSIDPSPIIGVASIIDKWSADMVKDENVRKKIKSENAFSYAFYFPEMVLYTGAKGEIMNLGRNEIITDILTADRNANATKNMHSPKGEDLEKSGNGILDSERMRLDEAYVKAMFQISYRQNCRASVTTIPILKDSSAKVIYPGRVLTVFDKESESNLFYGYITRVIVRGSTDGSGGSTMITMTHARPTGPHSTLIDEGTENPCYPPIEDRKIY